MIPDFKLLNLVFDAIKYVLTSPALRQPHDHNEVPHKSAEMHLQNYEAQLRTYLVPQHTALEVPTFRFSTPWRFPGMTFHFRLTKRRPNPATFSKDIELLT